MAFEQWRYIINTRNCYVNQEGDVRQGDEILEPFTHGATAFRWVELTLETRNYDYENGGWLKQKEKIPVWQLMKQAWFLNWPTDSTLYFVDGDPWNCSLDNIRAWSNDYDRPIFVRHEENGLAFDKRLRGKVEIVELGIVANSPSEAARLINGTKSGVSLVLSHRLETHKKFHFRWVFEEK